VTSVIRRCRDAGDRRHDHDRTAAFDQRRQRFARLDERAREVGGDAGVPRVVVRRGDLGGALTTRVGHEHVEAAESLDRGLDGRAHVLGTCRIPGDRDRSDVGRDQFERLGTAAQQDDARPFGRETPGRSGADPRASAADLRDLG
jgi:hypothetical protein